jgi:hypothetical protein
MRPLLTIAAAVTVGATGLGVLIAEHAAGPLTAWRVVIPGFFLAAALLLPLLLWMQHRRSTRALAIRTLQQPLGKLIAANAGLVALLQVGLSLRTTTHPPPVRPLLRVHAEPRKAAVAVSVDGANRSGADLPVLGDLINVIAADCPPGLTGRQLEMQRRRQRQMYSGSGSSQLLGSLIDAEGCRNIRLLDTSALAGEASFLPDHWRAHYGADFALPRGTNSVCVMSVQTTVDYNPRRLQVVDDAADVGSTSDLRYRYRLQPAGWLDELIHGTREVVVTWTPNTYVLERPYAVPAEDTQWRGDGKPVVSNKALIPPGPISTAAWTCAGAF